MKCKDWLLLFGGMPLVGVSLTWAILTWPLRAWRRHRTVSRRVREARYQMWLSEMGMDRKASYLRP